MWRLEFKIAFRTACMALFVLSASQYLWLPIPIAAAAEARKQWQFSETNDPGNKGRLTARLIYGVPETDDVQVSGVCEGAPSTSAKFSSVTFGADTGDLSEGSSVDLRFTGGGFEHVVRGTVHGTQAEVGVSGVHADLEHTDKLWDAFLEKRSLDYLVPSYRAASLELEQGRDKIRSFIASCRAYAEAILGNAGAGSGSKEAAAGGGPSEKEAFQSAKELGTLEAWNAFLGSYPSGFHADLARAYVKKLAGSAAAGGNGVTGHDVTSVKYDTGVFIKNGPNTWVEQKFAGGDALRFVETSRSSGEVKLFDKSRNVHITLDIAGGTIWYAEGSSPSRKLYDIIATEGSAAPPPPAPSVVAAAPAKSVAPSSADGGSCRLLRSIRSQNSNTPAKITFLNRSGMYRSILWLDFKGEPKSYAGLNSGEQVTLDTYLTHPWMVTDGPGNCIEIYLPSHVTRVVTLGSDPRGGGPASSKTKSSKKKGCSKGSVLIEGNCVLKRDVSTYCGPGYRVKGGKCVPGYQKPKSQRQLPTWQLEAIKKGCKPGQGWNAQEGCHEND